MWITVGRPLLVAMLLPASLGLAQAEPATSRSACEPGMLVFDASGSMRGTRIDQARSAAAAVLPALTAQRPVGLVTYGGHDRGGERTGSGRCSNVRVRLPPGPDAGEAILAIVETIEPDGSTPITAAVEVAAATLLQSAKAGVIVLVTDGEENCGGDPCALGAAIAAASGQLKVHVIGFRLRIAAGDALACLADRTRGTYAEASSVRELSEALADSLGCAATSAVNGHRLARRDR